MDLGRQQQPAVVHRIAEDRVQGIAVRAGAALVAGKQQEGLGRPILAAGIAFELDLGHGRPGTADVPRRRVHQQVLAGAVETGRARLLGGGEEGVPGEAVDVRRAHTTRVAHDEGDVIAGVRDHAVQQQLPLDGIPHSTAGATQHAFRRPGMSADRAHVGLDHGQGDLHGIPPSIRFQRSRCQVASRVPSSDQ